jgi:hypothetical protein
MKVHFKNEKKPICIEIFIRSLKYINIFLIFVHEVRQNFFYVLQRSANQKSLRTIGVIVLTVLYGRWYMYFDAASLRLVHIGGRIRVSLSSSWSVIL